MTRRFCSDTTTPYRPPWPCPSATLRGAVRIVRPCASLTAVPSAARVGAGSKLEANEVREAVSQTGERHAHDAAGAVIAVRPREGAEDDDATTTQNDKKADARSVQSEENNSGCAR